MVNICAVVSWKWCREVRVWCRRPHREKVEAWAMWHTALQELFPRGLPPAQWDGFLWSHAIPLILGCWMQMREILPRYIAADLFSFPIKSFSTLNWLPLLPARDSSYGIFWKLSHGCPITITSSFSVTFKKLSQSCQTRFATGVRVMQVLFEMVGNFLIHPRNRGCCWEQLENLKCTIIVRHFIS